MNAQDTSAAQQTLASVLLSMRPDLSAATLEMVTPAEAARTLLRQPAVVAASVLDHMLPQQAAPVIVALGERTQEVLSLVSSPRTVGAMRWLEEDQRQAILEAVGGALGRELRDSLAYPANTAASLMDPQVISARLTDTVGQALTHIKGVRKSLHQIYVVDSEQLLVGVVPIQDLAVAPPEQTLQALVTPQADTVDAFADQDDVAELLASTATPTIAVVDSEGRLIGALRHRALLGIAEEDAAAMMQQMVGASPDERALSPVRLAVKKRLPWLNINLLTAFIAAAVVGLFESTIAQVTSLAILLPVVAGQSGNSGSQALAVTMRGLALREIRGAHWPRVALKEVLVGLANGVAIASVCSVAVFLWSGSVTMAIVIAASMILSMAAAGLAGASIPIVLKRLGQDPAQSSSIILTTFTDVIGFSSFLGLATILIDLLV